MGQPVAVRHGGVVPQAPRLGQPVLAGGGQHRLDRTGGAVVDVEAEGPGGAAAARAQAGRDRAAEHQVGQVGGGGGEAEAVAGGARHDGIRARHGARFRWREGGRGGGSEFGQPEERRRRREWKW